jgi:hypothetical protein
MLTYLKFRSHPAAPSFRNAKQMKAMIELMPSGPTWKSTNISVNGYNAKSRITLFWRDAIECVQHVYGNPILADAMEHEPYRIYGSASKRVRYFAGPMSGDWAWDVQVCIVLLPEHFRQPF